MGQEIKHQRGPRIRVKHYDIPTQAGIARAEAKRLLDELLQAIPDAELAKLRAGHLTIIM